MLLICFASKERKEVKGEAYSPGLISWESPNNVSAFRSVLRGSIASPLRSILPVNFHEKACFVKSDVAAAALFVGRAQLLPCSRYGSIRCEQALRGCTRIRQHAVENVA